MFSSKSDFRDWCSQLSALRLGRFSSKSGFQELMLSAFSLGSTALNIFTQIRIPGTDAVSFQPWLYSPEYFHPNQDFRNWCCQLSALALQLWLFSPKSGFQELMLSAFSTGSTHVSGHCKLCPQGMQLCDGCLLNSRYPGVGEVG